MSREQLRAMMTPRLDSREQLQAMMTTRLDSLYSASPAHVPGRIHPWMSGSTGEPETSRRCKPGPLSALCGGARTAGQLERSLSSSFSLPRPRSDGTSRCKQAHRRASEGGAARTAVVAPSSKQDELCMMSVRDARLLPPGSLWPYARYASSPGGDSLRIRGGGGKGRGQNPYVRRVLSNAADHGRWEVASPKAGRDGRDDHLLYKAG